jgi:hypothetical protein
MSENRTLSIMLIVVCLLLLSVIAYVSTLGVEFSEVKNVEIVQTITEHDNVIFKKEEIVLYPFLVSHLESDTIYKVLRLTKQISELLNGYVSECGLLALLILGIIKGLRRGRPRGYHGIEWYTL